MKYTKMKRKLDLFGKLAIFCTIMIRLYSEMS